MATTTHTSILRGPQDASYTVTIRRPGAEGEIVYPASSDDVQEVEGGALEFSWDGLPLDTDGRFSGRLIWTGNAGDVVVESVNVYEPPPFINATFGVGGAPDVVFSVRGV